MLNILERKLSRKTPVFDHADQLLFEADRERATDLMLCDHVDVIGTTTRIKALRFRGPDPAGQLLSGSHPKRQLGQVHKAENYFNPAGVWAFDRIPSIYREAFVGVLTSVAV